GSIAPGPITCLMLLQIRRNVGGSCARTFQKLLTQSVFRVAMMSSYTARTGADALAYSIGSRLAVISSTSGGAPRGGPSLACPKGGQSDCGKPAESLHCRRDQFWRGPDACSIACNADHGSGRAHSAHRGGARRRCARCRGGCRRGA